MKIFFGAAIQGVHRRGERADIYRHLLDVIKSEGGEVATEHTAAPDTPSTSSALEKALGTLPPDGLERRVFVRDRMIAFVEGDIDAAVFEVSTPSLGTGIELAHAYLRPRMGLEEIPILALYQKDYWPNQLSSMIRGLKLPAFQLVDYACREEAGEAIRRFLRDRVPRR